MEVKNIQAALLCNYEVLSVINETKPTIVNKEASQLATVMYETSHYLQELPCNKQNPEKIERLLTELTKSPIPLTKLEKFMICNDPPTSLLQLSLIVKDCEEKLTDEDKEEDMKSWLNNIREASGIDSDAE